MKIYPSNLNHIRFTKPTNEEIQQEYNFPCSITVLNQALSTAEVFYYDGEGNEFPQGRFNISSDYLFQKTLLKTDTAPTIKGLYPLSETGVYTNLGGIDAQSGKLNFASFDGTTWSLIAVNINSDILYREAQYLPNGNVVLNDLGQVLSCSIKWADGTNGTLINSNYNDLVFEYEKTTVTHNTKTIVYDSTFDTNGNIINKNITIL